MKLYLNYVRNEQQIIMIGFISVFPLLIYITVKLLQGGRSTIYLIYSVAKADNYDADSVNKVIDTNISRFNEKGYGIKYLLDCLKVDDNEYYKSITKKDMIIESSNDDVGASEIVLNYYKI